MFPNGKLGNLEYAINDRIYSLYKLLREKDIKSLFDVRQAQTVIFLNTIQGPDRYFFSAGL